MAQETFGGFITRKRLKRDMTLRGCAEKLGISPVYMCNIEKDRRAAPSGELLEKMAALLLLTDDEKIRFLDLAAQSKNAPSVALDLPEYINGNEMARIALRTAKEADATDKEWLDFINGIKKRAGLM